MLAEIRDYIESLYVEAKTSILNDFDISEQKDFTPFDYINFYIINKHILEENSDDLFISIPEDQYRDNFFESVFYSVALIKLFQNFCSYKTNLPELNENDIIYKNDKLYTYKGSSDENIRVVLKFPKPNQKDCTYYLPLGIYTKLSKEFDYRKSKTIELIQGFSNFLKEKFKDKAFPFLTEFPCKTLVIADQKYFKVNENLPTRYWTKTGHQKHQIPVDILIEICNDFKTAEKYLFEKGYIFDELIVIGDSKYGNDVFTQIQNAKWTGKIKNIILIGSEKPATNHVFKEWLWSTKEIKIASNEEPKEINKIVIPNVNLLNQLKDFKVEIEALSAQYGVDVLYILRYVNFYLRLILFNSENANAVVREYSDRIKAHLDCDDFKIKFYDKDIYDDKIIQSASDKIRNRFKTIEDFFLSENIKWDSIVDFSKKNNRVYLIIEKRSYDYIKKQIQKKKLDNIRLISDKRIDSNTPYLDKWINSHEKNIPEKKYIIPYLNNLDIFKKLHYLNGNCSVLCFEGIDELAFDKISLQVDDENHVRLKHSDRKKFTNTAFLNVIPATINKGLESLFELNLPNQKESNPNDESFDAPRDEIFYELTFEDNITDVFKSTKAIFLVDGTEQIKTTIGEIYNGALIRFYRNESPEAFQKILTIFDVNNQMANINKQTESWRWALKKLRAIYPNNALLFAELFKNKKSIQLSTFLNYLESNSKIRFPRNSTMGAIKDLCIASGLHEIDFVINFDLILKLSKEDKRIRQQAGRILGSDLIDYVASGLLDKSESLCKIPDEVLEKVVKSIVEKKIKSKTILNNDDDRIFKQSEIDFS